MIYAKIKNQEEQKRLDDTLKSSQKKNWYRRLQINYLYATFTLITKVDWINLSQ